MLPGPDSQLPDPVPGDQGETQAQFKNLLRLTTAVSIARDVVLGRSGPVTDPAQQAVIGALAGVVTGPSAVRSGGLGPDGTGVPYPLPESGSAAAAAARRLGALPSATLHTWLAGHLPALRAGRVSLDQLP